MKLLSKVIKSFQYGSLIEEPAPQLFEQNDCVVDEQCRIMLDQAFQKAQQIVESAQSYKVELLQDCAKRTQIELKESKKRGYQEGYDRGYQEGEKAGTESGMQQGLAEGLQKAEKENQKYLNELAKMIQSVETSKEDILARFESDLTDLAVTIARTIIKKELVMDEKTLHHIIQNAVDSYRNQEWVRIYVSEKTADVLTKADVTIAQELKSVSDHVKVVVRDGMSDESCVIEMPNQVIDAGIDTQLNTIQSALDEAIRPEMRITPERKE